MRFRLFERGADGTVTRLSLVITSEMGMFGAVFKAQVAIGQNADELVALGDRNAGDAIALHQFERVGDLVVRRHGDRIDDHAAFRALHFVDFAGLLLDGEIAMDDAESALLRHGNGQARFRHGVHGRADDGKLQANIAG